MNHEHRYSAGPEQPGLGDPEPLLCCLPVGIVSIVYAAQVNGKLAAGDIAGAQDSSAKAKKWAIWSAIAWVIMVVLYVLFFVVLGGIGAMSNGSY